MTERPERERCNMKEKLARLQPSSYIIPSLTFKKVEGHEIGEKH